MLSLKVGLPDTIENPLCKASMLGCGLIIVTEQTKRKRFGDASVMGPSKYTQIHRRDGIAIVYGPEKGIVAALGDPNTVPDPVVIVVVVGKPSRKVETAAKKRKAQAVIGIEKGHASVALATNSRKGRGVEVTELGKKPKSTPPARASDDDLKVDPVPPDPANAE